MTKQEFEKRIGAEISQKDYSIVEHVYTWHPSISEVEGKEQIAELYKSFGMPIIKNMMEAANYAETLDREMAQAQRQVEELRKRIIRVAKGDLVVEQCITEAKKLFETVNDPHEWDVAVSYLKKRYGADAVDEAIKIEHLEMQEGSESVADRSHTGSTGHGFWMCRVEVCDFRERQYHMQRISNEPKAAKKKARN